jgi:uncharacterized membrane protein
MDRLLKQGINNHIPVNRQARQVAWLALIAAFLLANCFKTDVHWQAFQRSAFSLALAMVMALLLYGLLALIGWIGIGQRIYLIVSLVWLFLMAIRLRSIAITEATD